MRHVDTLELHRTRALVLAKTSHLLPMQVRAAYVALLLTGLFIKQPALDTLIGNKPKGSDSGV